MAISGGDGTDSYGPCVNPDYVAAGTAGAADLKASIDYLVNRPDIDRSRVISVGVSAGGFATVALTADPPPELVAAISFAGGRGSIHNDEVCHGERLVEAFRSFGKRSRIPMLWVYAENDRFFGPSAGAAIKERVYRGWRKCRVHRRTGIWSRWAQIVFSGRHPGVERICRCVFATARSCNSYDSIAAAPAPRPCRAEEPVTTRPRGVRNLHHERAAQGVRAVARRPLRLAIRATNDGGRQERSNAVLPQEC